MACGPHLDSRRHCGLEMSAADERNCAFLLAEFTKSRYKSTNFLFERENFALHVKAHIDGDLIVARSAGMDFLSEIAELFYESAFYGHVHILVVFTNDEIALLSLGDDIRQFLANFCVLGFGDDGLAQAFHLAEHRHMRGSAHAVPFDKRHVENGVLADSVCKNILING
jgi:hypothetical protein